MQAVIMLCKKIIMKKRKKEGVAKIDWHLYFAQGIQLDSDHFVLIYIQEIKYFLRDLY